MRTNPLGTSSLFQVPIAGGGGKLHLQQLCDNYSRLRVTIEYVLFDNKSQYNVCKCDFLKPSENMKVSSLPFW